MSKYGQDRSSQNKVTVITGLPGTGKSHLLKNKIIPQLVAKKKRVLIVDPNMEYSPNGKYVRVFRLKDYYKAESEVETMISYYLTHKGEKRPDVLIVDESNVVFSKTTLQPSAKKLVNTLRHEKIDLICVARRPVDINITISELARERYIFETHGYNDIKRLNEIINGLGDQVDQLRDHAYIHVTNDNNVEVIRPAKSTHA